MSDIETKARELRELIDQYWSLAYAEGEERRDHDTEDGDAQRVSMEIDSAIRSMAALTPPEGYVLVPVELTEKMVKAVYPLHYFTLLGEELREHWRALLAARPEAK